MKVLQAIGSLILVLGIVFGLSFLSLGHYGFFAPKYAKVKRQVFEQTQSYIEGKRQEAAKLYYESKTTDNADTICQVIRISFANFDTTLLNDNTTETFINSCK